MSPTQFITSRLEALQGSAQRVSENLEEDIYAALMSKKFRKYSVNPEYQEHIRNAIHLNVSKGEPIKLVFVFGGYKLWRLEESPEPDWGELFALMYYAKWLRSICEIYEPGVWFDFYSDDVILETMDNLPKTDTEQYLATFKALISFLTPHIPKNLVFTLNRVGEQYKDMREFQTEIESLKSSILDENNGKHPSMTPENYAVVELNVKLKPGQDKDPEWREKVFLTHEAYARVSKRRPYYRRDDKIMLITKQLKNTLAVGTTKTSIAKFWAGVGALKKTDESFIETILSPSQLNAAQFEWLPASLPDLTGMNFKKIRII